MYVYIYIIYIFIFIFIYVCMYIKTYVKYTCDCHELSMVCPKRMRGLKLLKTDKKEQIGRISELFFDEIA